MAPPLDQPSPLPPPADLPEELVEEILLRFPPDEPASLFRAALVCKPWCRFISRPRFRRRFRELHRTPPMLGYLCNRIYKGARFLPKTTFCSPRAYEALDARHGRVLLRWQLLEEEQFLEEDELLVWDPITGEERGVPFPPRRPVHWRWTATVLCADTGACDHLDCHRGPFLVVFVGLDPSKMFVCTYSSDVKAWTEPISTKHPDPDNHDFLGFEKHAVLVGNGLYFGIWSDIAIKYNLELCEMSLIQLPWSYDEWPWRYMLTTTEEGVLGLVTGDHYGLHMWLMKDAAEVDAGCSWTQSRFIDLRTLFTHDGIFTSPYVVGVADGLGIIFATVENLLYAIDLKACMVELYKYQDRGIDYIVPYMSFYTPELGAACTSEEPSAGGSSA